MPRHGYLPVASGLLRRPRVESILRKGMDYPFTAIVGGFGYGKTTSLATFALKLENPLIWIHVTEMDNEIPYFWNTFITAVRRELPDWADTLEQLGFPGTPSQFLAWVHTMEQFKTQEKPLVCVIDNFEVITAPAIQQYMLRCLDMAVSRREFHIFLVCNERLSSDRYPLSKIAGGVGYHHISPSELAFTPEETSRLFSFYGKPLDEANAERITAEAEGWPLLLYLQCTSQKKADSISVLAEMFESQYFSNYSEPMQHLLVKLSMLPFFTMDIVNVFSDNNSTAAMRLITLNTFIHYDHDAQIFNFHPMYKKVLSVKQALIPEIERRKAMQTAALFFLQGNRANEAKDLFLYAKDFDGFLQCLEMQSKSYVGASSALTVMRCLEQFPDDYVEDNPQIDLYKALILLTNAQINQARNTLQLLLNRLDERPEQRLLAGEACRVISDISLLQNRVDGMEYICRAVEYLPGGSRIQNKAIHGVDENPVFFLAGTGAGSLADMVQYIREFTALREKVSGGSMYGYEFLFEAEAALFTLDYDRAEGCALQGLYKAKSAEQCDIVLGLYLLLIRCAFFRRNFDLVQSRMQQAEDYCASLNTISYTELLDIIHAWYYMALDDDKRMADWIKEYDPKVYAEKPLWQGRNLYFNIIYRLRKGDLPQALYLLSRLEAVMEERPLWSVNQLTCLLQSMINIQDQKPAQALDALYKVYEATHLNGIYYHFTEIGQYIYPVLKLAASDNRFDKDWLATVSAKAEGGEDAMCYMREKYREERKGSDQYTIELTTREREVLSLLKEGYSNVEIAKKVLISSDGVKKRLSSIYTKLGAKNRADAIYIATLNGWI